MAKSLTPKVSGFNIELPSTTFILSVQDVNGNLIEGADIIIDCDGETITGKTDALGAFAGVVPPGLVCTLTVGSDCYKAFVQRFVLVPIDNTKNLVIKVVDGSDNPVDAADVTITSSIPASVTGQTDTDGMFETAVNTSFSTTITIQKSGFQDLEYTFKAFSPVGLSAADYRIVPVITMQP